MSKQSQDYTKTSFNDVAQNYDKIRFFKISAKHIVNIIQTHTSDTHLSILDVACGTGNVVLECASSLKNAQFDAADISDGMLTKAIENAKEQNINNITFKLQDITTMKMDKNYDIITCSYAMFFLPQASIILKRLVSILSNQGILVFTTFLAKAFSPSNKILLPLLRKYGSATAQNYDINKWENLKHTSDIQHLCKEAHIGNYEIQTKEIRYGMNIDQWWELLNNTGYKGMLLELSEAAYQSLKGEYYAEMFTYADMDGEVELIADSYFVIIRK